MANPSYASTPAPFDPPDNRKPVYDGLTASQRSRLVKLHHDGKQTWSASLDPALQDAGLLFKIGTTHALISGWGADVAAWAWSNGVTP